VYKQKIRYLIIFCIFLYTSFAQANNQTYYLDLDYIMNNSLAGKSITEQLEKKSKKTNDFFKKKENDLKNEESKIVAQKNILDENEYKNKINLFREKISKFNNDRKNSINDFNKKKINAQNSLIKTLVTIVKEYAIANGAAIIVDKKNIVVGKNELDITKIILKTLNSKIKNIKLK
jgi:Skp family chaperone for outer membrane proteins